MGGLPDASGSAGLTERVAEAFLGERRPAPAADERQVATGAGGKRGGQHRNRDGYVTAALLGAERGNSVPDMLSPKRHRVAAAQPGVEQDVQPNPLLGADRPPLLITVYVVFGPDRDSRTLRARRVGNSGGRVDLDVIGLDRPTKEAAHRVEEVAGLGRRLASALAALQDVLTRDLGIWLGAG